MNDIKGRLAVLVARDTLIRREKLVILFGEQRKVLKVDLLDTEGVSTLNHMWSSAILAAVCLKANIAA